MKNAMKIENKVRCSLVPFCYNPENENGKKALAKFPQKINLKSNGKASPA